MSVSSEKKKYCIDKYLVAHKKEELF